MRHHSGNMSVNSIWDSPTARSVFFQIMLLLGVFYLSYYFFNNALDNLEQQGIASGFAFLRNPAGFDIIMHLIDYSEKATYFRALLVSLLNTLLLSFLGIFFATFLGVIIGIARLSKNWMISKLSAIYIETFRNLPLLLQIFFWYFAILRILPNPRNSYQFSEYLFLNIRGLYMPRPIIEPGFYAFITAFLIATVFSFVWVRIAKMRQEKYGEQLPIFFPCLMSFILLPLFDILFTGIPLSFELPVLRGFNFQGGITIIPELTAMLIALSIYTASFIAEIVRAGILSVNRGQTEAAYALGLKATLTTRLIILPQALRVIIPPLTSQYLNLTKNSSLAAAIAYPELVSVFAGTVLNQTGQAIEVISITMSIYLLISLSISLFMNWYNHKMALVER